MSNSFADLMFEYFIANHTNYKNAVDCYYLSGRFELTIELINGDIIYYDIADEMITKYLTKDKRKDVTDMSDDEYRCMFSSTLKRKLYDLRMTQRDLADVTDINEMSISNYINGKTIPTFINMAKIAKALKCDVVDFYKF